MGHKRALRDRLGTRQQVFNQLRRYFNEFSTILAAMELLFIFILLGVSNCERPLAGHHLNIVMWETPAFVESKINGRIENTTSYWEVFKWLSAKLGFSYAIVGSSPLFQNSSTVRGFSSFLLTGEADAYAGALSMTDSVYAAFDVPFPWITMSTELLIPVPEPSNNFGAPWQTFSATAWICIAVTFVAVIVALYVVNKKHFLNTGEHSSKKYFFDMSLSTNYATSVLFSQGGFCLPKQHSIRLVAGIWCVGAFFLVNFYNSVLISLITKPIQEPIVNSVYDLPNKPNVYMVVEKGMGIDRIISGAESGILKYIDGALNNKPSFRCTALNQCLEKVIEGSHVLIQAREMLQVYLKKFIIPRYGKCRVKFAKEGFLTMFASFALPKNSPYTYYFNKETIYLYETGLLQMWRNEFTPPPPRCISNQSKKTRIGVNNLSSTFIIFSVGIAISVFTFLLEIACCNRKWRP